MKGNRWNIRVALLAMAFACGTSHAASIYWDAAAVDEVWTNTANWTGGVLPTSEDLAYISTGATVTYSEGMTNNVNRNIINEGSTLNITGGFLHGAQAGNTVRDIVGQGEGHSYLNQSGGFYRSAHIWRIGIGGIGTVNLSGGETDISRGGNSSFGNPTVSVSIGDSSGQGTLNITDSIFMTRVGVEVGENGVFHVRGGSSSIILGASSDHVSNGAWYQQSNGVLRVGISTNGLTPIVIEKNSDTASPQVIFNAGSILDVSFVDGAMETNSWAVLENTSGTFNNLGLVFAEGVDTNDWGYITSNNVLYVGYGLGWPAGDDVLGPPVSQRTLYWTGNGGDTASDNPTNWVLDTAATLSADWGPYDNDVWEIGNIAVTGIELGTNYEVDYDGTAINNQRDVTVGTGAQGTLNYNSGDLAFTSYSSSRQEFGVNSNGDGTLNLNGGTLSLNAARFGVSGGTGTFNLNGGTLNISRGYGDYSLWIGNGSGSTGIVNVVGGRMFTRHAVQLGGSSSHGTFSVEGSAASVIQIGSLGNSLHGAWYQNSGSILKLRVDSGGVTPINIIKKEGAADDAHNGNVYFYEGAILDIGWMEGVTNYNSFDVMTWGGSLMANELEFASNVDTNIWSFEMVDTNSDTTNDTLRVTAYGETSNGTPYSWLLKYGLTEADDHLDTDGDGLLTWEEYIAGTNPTNAASVLTITSNQSLDNGDYVVTWQSVEGKSYSVITNTSLSYPTTGTVASDILGEVNETSYTGTMGSAETVFYEIGVE